jgi:hypothetical protein
VSPQGEVIASKVEWLKAGALGGHRIGPEQPKLTQFNAAQVNGM